MSKQLKSLLLPAALVVSAAVGAPPALASASCPNEQLRAENNSQGLADCRAYELTTPESNHAAFAFLGKAAAGGNAVVYSAFDAPDTAASGLAPINYTRAQRNPVQGWRDVSFAPPLPVPAGVFIANRIEGYSEDLSSAAVVSDQPLAGASTPPGQNAFVERSDGSFRLVSDAGAPFYPLTKTYPSGPIPLGGTPDYGHVYFQFGTSQLSPDPGGEAHQIYSFSEEEGLKLLSFLPGGELPPGGAGFANGLLKPFSADGTYAAFVAASELYLRVDETETIDIAPVAINPGVEASPQAGVTSDGSKLVFADRAELTPDANTGTGETGRDLYSYDTASRQLSDLTVDTDPADASTGANVLHVFGATPDGGYVYFTATGHLADGAAADARSLYVVHNGHIAFIANAEGLGGLYVTPDGQYLALVSTATLTDYDNQGHPEVYETTGLGGALVCASCRPDGTSPTGSAGLGPGRSVSSEGIVSSEGTGRSVSNDGTVFFVTTDALLPGVFGGISHVFEYSHGAISPISPLTASSSSQFVDASESGDDVFFETFEGVVPNPNAGDHAIYDARVDGGFPLARASSCEVPACQGDHAAPPLLVAPGTSTFSGPGNVSASPAAAAKAPQKPLTRAQKLTKALKACNKKPARQRPRCRAQAKKRYGGKAANRNPATAGRGK